MKANEVRIGNYLEIEATPARIKTFVLSMANQGLSLYLVSLATEHSAPKVYPFDQCLPIKLNAEWLADFGFSLAGGTWSNADLALFEDSYEYRFIFNTSRVKVLYVHQLQNLYYALFSEELKLDNGSIFKNEPKQ
jgi:hypothetical protein